jgi:hypothetical protein
MLRLSLLAILLVACRDPPPPPPPEVKLTAAQKAEVQALVDAAFIRVKAAEAKRNSAFAQRAVRATPAPCPVSQADLGITADLTRNGLTTTVLKQTRVVLPGGQRPDTGKALSSLETEASIIKMNLEKTSYAPAGVVASARRTLDEIQPTPFEMALVLDRFAEPKQVDDKSFVSGRTTGTLYLWSEKAGAIVCAAPVDAESSDEASVTMHSFGGRPSAEERSARMAARLTGQLIVNTVMDGLAKLTAVEPASRAGAKR